MLNVPTVVCSTISLCVQVKMKVTVVCVLLLLCTLLAITTTDAKPRGTYRFRLSDLKRGRVGRSSKLNTKLLRPIDCYKSCIVPHPSPTSILSLLKHPCYRWYAIISVQLAPNVQHVCLRYVTYIAFQYVCISGFPSYCYCTPYLSVSI